MAYSTGFLKERVTIRNKVAPTGQAFGETTRYADAATVWAAVDWKKGAKTLNNGTLDAQDTVLIRMRWNSIIRRDSQLVHDGTTYQIQSIHRDRQDNTIQVTVTELI